MVGRGEQGAGGAGGRGRVQGGWCGALLCKGQVVAGDRGTCGSLSPLKRTVNVSSENRRRRHVFPTPESPIRSSLNWYVQSAKSPINFYVDVL